MNINANFTFGCDASRGALLFLQDFADEAMHISKKQIIDYMRLNYRSWILFGSERGIVTDNEIMGPIFIRSTIKTSAWLVAAWMRQTRSNDAMVQCSSGHANAFLSFSLASGVNPSVQYRILPPHQQPPAVGTERDQCIFIDYFRFKERFFFNRQIVAAAEPRPDDAERFSEDKAGVLANNEETDPENEVIRVENQDSTAHHERSPSILLMLSSITSSPRYISFLLRSRERLNISPLKQHPQADLAIASHGDLSLAFKVSSPFRFCC